MPQKKSRTSCTPASLNVVAWRKYTKDESRLYINKLYGVRTKKRVLKKQNEKKVANKFLLAVRKNLSPVDMYCYLKARFGEPNGFQTFLRKDDSDNWIHWDYYLKAGDKDVHISGTSREIHFLLTENLSDQEWYSLISNIKTDYKRVGAEKSAILNSLEKWVIFPNKFVEIASICEEHHLSILKNIEGYKPFRFSSFKTKKQFDEQKKVLARLGHRAKKLYKNCVELSLLTPILAEAFINMLILMSCKKEIRNNKRQFDSFVRSHIDTKIFDLFYKCEHFVKPIDPNSEEFKNFKKIMDKRNNAIHANVDPINEQIETVYFEGNRPLYKDSGDHVGKVFEGLERQYQPSTIIKDYEDVHMFLHDIANHLTAEARLGFWRVMEDNYPGYDVNRRRMGALFPHYSAVGMLPGLRYDDELVLE